MYFTLVFLLHLSLVQIPSTVLTVVYMHTRYITCFAFEGLNLTLTANGNAKSPSQGCHFLESGIW